MRISTRRPKSSDEGQRALQFSESFIENLSRRRSADGNDSEAGEFPHQAPSQVPGHDLGRLPNEPGSRATIQPQTKISTPGDASERAADEEADRVTRPPDAGLQQGLVQSSKSPTTGNSAGGHSASAGGGTRLSPEIRDRFEPRFGHDFSRVRVHADARASESAHAFGARAFTLGNHIVFGQGEYAPSGGSGEHLLAHELAHVVQQSESSSISLQREGEGDTATAESPSSGELAWEIFSPIAKDAVRSLAPGVLTSTKTGEHYKEVIEVVDKLEDSMSKLSDYASRIEEMRKSAADEDTTFALKSMGKVNSHFASIPDALEIDSDALIQEASTIVTSDMFTDMESSIARLKSYEAIVEHTKSIREPYARMVSKLGEAEERVKASFEALGILGDALEDLIPIAVLPAYQAWLFSTSQKVKSYRSDVGTILSTIRSKKDGYQQTIDGSEQMENYMLGIEGRKATEERYRDPKDAIALALVKAGLPGLKGDDEAIYEEILPYYESTFENIMDALDFLPIDDSDGFYAVTNGLLDAFPDRENEIEAKEARYELGITLYLVLEDMRPTLESIEAQLDPLIAKYVYQEYYLFWVDDPRSLLSNTRFTYPFQIEEMTQNALMLPLSMIAADYLDN